MKNYKLKYFKQLHNNVYICIYTKWVEQHSCISYITTQNIPELFHVERNL